MTDATISALVSGVVAIVAALPATLAALAAFRQSKVNSGKTDILTVAVAETKQQTETVVGKTDELINKTNVIHELTNSQAARRDSENQVLSEKVAGLEKLILSLNQERASAALAVAYATPVVPSAALVEKQGPAKEALREAVFDAVHSTPPIPVTITDLPVPVKNTEEGKKE